MKRKIFICGASEWGKSTLARQLTAGERRRVILDPSGDWARKGLPVAHDLQEVSNIYRDNYRKGFTVVYVPTTGREALYLHNLSLLVWSYQCERARFGYTGEVMVIAEEMADCYSRAHEQSGALFGFRQLVTKGRHYGISTCGITQRPQDSAAMYRDLANEKYAFALFDDNGSDAASRLFRREHRSTYDGLAQFEYLALRDGVVTKGKTRKA